MIYPFEDSYKSGGNPKAILDAATSLKEESSYQPSLNGLDPRGFNTK